jgi:hypothetical protein
VYEGTLRGSKVCVKRIRVYSKDGPKIATKVCYRCHHFPGLPLLTRPTDPLPGGRGVEALETPKHRLPPRYHFHSTPAYIRVDVRRGSHRIHYGAPQHRPAWSRECHFFRFRPRTHSDHQLFGVAEGLRFLHARNIIHGNLKGVRNHSKPS